MAPIHKFIKAKSEDSAHYIVGIFTHLSR